MKKAVSNTGTPSLEPIKKELRVSAKQAGKMRVGSFYFCDYCNMAIYNPEDGFVIHGNVYEADPTCRGGLIGNNFPEVEPGTKIEVTDVKETVLCSKCLFEILTRDKKLAKVESQRLPDWIPPEPESSDYLDDILDNDFVRELQDIEVASNIDLLQGQPPSGSYNARFRDSAPF